MILELASPIPVKVVTDDCFPSGDGLAYFLLNDGPDQHILWAVVYNDTGAVWWVPNPLIRFKENLSLGRNLT